MIPRGSWGFGVWGSSVWGGDTADRIFTEDLRAATLVTKPDIQHTYRLVGANLQTTPTVTKPALTFERVTIFDCVGYTVTGSISYALVNQPQPVVVGYTIAETISYSLTGSTGYSVISGSSNAFIETQKGYDVVSCTHSS